MATSVVSLFLGLFRWLAFGFGILFNSILIRLIVRHTPKQMRIYSKVLLQTCVTDLSLLFMMFLFFPCNFITEKGEFEAILYGLVTIKGVEKGIWNLLAFVCFVFLVYVSMFGYVSQFIFRYFLIVRGKTISALNYFLLFFLMLLFPFAYCVHLFICYFPPAEHALMEDKSVAEILGINLDEQIPLAAYSFNGLQQTVGLYYIITLCTFAYLLMFTLAYDIKKCLDNESKLCTDSSHCSLWTRKRIVMNKQISRNLLIQLLIYSALVPVIIYFDVLFLLILSLLKIDTKGWDWLQYYHLLSPVPMCLPSVLNAMISICTINYYRCALISAIKHLGNFFLKTDHPISSVNVQKLQQKEQQPAKWAISVIKREKVDFPN